MLRPSRDLLLGEQDVGHRYSTKVGLADKTLVVGSIVGRYVDVDVHVTDRSLPGGIALRPLDTVCREHQVHLRNPFQAEASRHWQPHGFRIATWGVVGT